MFFYRSQNHLNFYEFCYDTTETNEVIAAMKKDKLRAKCERSSKARKGSFPDHSDDSKSRSEVTSCTCTTTESSPAYSTWTDTFSPEPKSFGIDPPEKTEGETSRPNVSSETAQKNAQTLIVNLPPEKPRPRKDHTKLGQRNNSNSLEVKSEKVKNSPDKKVKENKANISLKGTKAVLISPKRVLLASAKPVSGVSVDPIPGTSKESDIAPGSNQSKIYVQESVKKEVAAPGTSRNVLQSNSPPPPAPEAPAGPIVNVKRQIFYLTEDCKGYEQTYVDATSAEQPRPPVKKVLFLNSTPINLESSFNAEPSNIGDAYDFQKLPLNDSEYELKRFQPLSVPSTSQGIQNYDLDSLNIFESRRYDLPEEDFIRHNRTRRYLPAVGKEFERRSNALQSQLQEDRVTEQHPTDYNDKPKRGDHPAIVGQQPRRRQHSEHRGLDSSSNEPRRQLDQTQDSRQFQGRETVRDIQTKQIRSRDINKTRDGNLKQSTEPPNVERTHLQQRQPQHTVQKKQRAGPQSEKNLNKQQATSSNNYNYQTQKNRPGDRPANSFWRRDFDNQIELESPPATDNTESRFAKGSERNSQQFPEVKSSPTHRRKYPAFSDYTYPEEFEPPLPKERHPNLYRERRNPPARERYPRRHMGRMGSLEDHERKVIIEFCHLLEKSKQLFNGLRELPHYGHKQWHSYFGRTFDVYTKLWKFQQQHRAVLDNKYGLKRWQIGEIASKIGQLYYHFYLRTSETAYLNEAFSFYYAIRGRSYYTKACKEDKCELMVKKLRYYARFIVVCLLIKKIKLVLDLIKELDRQIIEYGNTYDPDDQIEWTVVVDEVKAFVQTEPIVQVIHPDNYPVPLSHRLSPLTTPPVERSQQMNLTLHDILIVGSSSQQVKFSELTMDMFRMLQTLEREPTGEIQHMYDDSPRQRFNLTPSALNNKGYNLESGAPRSENPHKYLLFKPSPSQILVYLASACNDLPPNGVLLLYISADGQIVQPSKHPEDVGYDNGGLITTSKNELYRDSNKDKSSQAKNREPQCLYPGDLYPFTRRPFFVIIDSDNSIVFQNIPRNFGQPMLIFMSPVETPSGLHISQSERKQQGGLFTLFLHSPLTAICYIADLHSVPLIHWDRAQAYIDAFLAEASQILTRGRIDPMILVFMGDDFLRLLILRYMFCELVMRMHRAFRTRAQRPRSSPGIPDEILEHPALVHIVFDLASHLQIRSSFQEPNLNLERTSKE